MSRPADQESEGLSDAGVDPSATEVLPGAPGSTWETFSGPVSSLTEFPEVVLPGRDEPLTPAEAREYLPALLWLASQPQADERLRQLTRRLRGAL